MPTSELVQEAASEPLNCKTWILKVSIHCEGCKRKVNKILANIQGVYSADIETKQQKVIVTGTVDADTLINKLKKSGKHAELWPEISNQKEKKSAKPNNKDKQIPQNHDPRPNKEAGHGSSTLNADKEIKPPVEVKITGGGASAAKTSGDTKAGDVPVKVPGANEVKDSNSEGKVPETGPVSEIPIKVSSGIQGVKESKSEGKLPETSSDGKQSPAAPVEKKNECGKSDNVPEKSDAVGGANGGNDGGKKKKNKGQTGNKADSEPRSVAPPAGTGSLHYTGGPPPVSVTANKSVPHHQGPSHYYTPPPPAYGISYNTAHPSSSYTTSYYASPPPNAHAYPYSGSGSSMEGPNAFSYPGSSMEPRSTDFDSYPRLPLDSFEMFSDENPNGCSIS